MKPIKVIVKRDTATDLYTAFIQDFPGVVVQARDLKDVHTKMVKAWDAFIHMLQKKKLEIQDEAA